MRTITAGEFQQTCLRLLGEVEVSGEPILITKRGKPVAQLTPVAPQHREDWAGALRDWGAIHGDLVAPAVEAEPPSTPRLYARIDGGAGGRGPHP